MALKEFNEKELAFGNYYRKRENGIIEIGEHNNKTNKDTRLLIDTKALKINSDNIDHILYKCILYWYSPSSDTCIIDRKGGNLDYKVRKYNIMVDIDVNKLFGDKEYFKYFMEVLLDEDRVINMLEEDKKINSEKKCGGYIGKVELVEGMYRKKFYTSLGEKCYNLPENVEKRRQNLEKIRKYYDEEIERLNRERNENLELEEKIKRIMEKKKTK